MRRFPTRWRTCPRSHAPNISKLSHPGRVSQAGEVSEARLLAESDEATVAAVAAAAAGLAAALHEGLVECALEVRSLPGKAHTHTHTVHEKPTERVVQAEGEVTDKGQDIDAEDSRGWGKPICSLV